MKLRRLLSMLLSLLMLAAVATACSDNSSEKAPQQGSLSTQSGGGDPKSGAEIDTSEFVTVTHLSLGNKPTNGQLEAAMEEWNAYLREKVNAHLDINWVEWTDYMTKYNLLLASGEPLDLINSATDWLEMWPNAQKGAFLELDELLPVYAPVTWTEIPEENWAETRYNGNIVAIPEDQYTQWINHGMMYRGDWAGEFGIKVESWEDLGEYFQAAKDNYGGKGVIPWDTSGATNVAATFSGWFNSKTKYVYIDPVPGVYGAGWVWAESNDEWWKLVSPYFVSVDGKDLFLEYAALMKKWGDAGYWREDILNSTVDPWTQFKAGLSGAYQHHTQSYVGRYKEMERENPGADMQWFPWSMESKNLVSMSITHGATCIGANSRNPERALMVYDLVRNDEKMYRLFNWGREGVQYVITADGKRDKPEGYSNQTDEFYSNFWGGRMDKFELEYPNADMYDDWEKIYEEYDSYKVPYRYGQFVFDSNPVANELAAMSDVTSRLLPAISAGKAGDPADAVERMRAQLKSAGYDRFYAEVEAQMAKYKEMIDAQ